MGSFKKNWRLELFYKTTSELREKTLPFLKEHDIHRINLTNKTKNDRLMESVSEISKAIPSANICVHYSIKWNYPGAADPAFQRLKDFLSQVADVQSSRSVLLVSGGGKKKKLDTVEALRRLSKESGIPKVPLHVAFNPFIPDDSEAEEERRRLQQKLDTGLVAGIWLQTGSDIDRLEAGLKFLEPKLRAGKIGVYGSVFLPSKRLLAQMKFRPWNGVFLSKAYLSSMEAATEITKQLLKTYKRYSVVPLLESALRTTKDMRAATELLEVS